jgi:multiple sugar transport system substrate-binding protein
MILHGATWKNPRGYEPLAAAARVWHTRYPQITIEWHQFPWYEFEKCVLGGGDMEFDLVMFDHPWTGSLAGSRVLPWEPLLPPEYLAGLQTRVVSPSLESYELNGSHWALPLDAACHAGLFRADLLSDGQLPVYWDEVSAFAREHHRPDERYGLVLSVEGVLGHCLFLSMMAGIGHPAYLDAEDLTCDRPAAEYVLNLIKELLAFVPPGSENWGPWDIYQWLVTTDGAVYSPSIFAYANYFGPGKRASQLRLCPVPSFRGCGPGRPILGGVGLGITTGCKFVKEAVEYSMFLMDDDTQRDLFPAHHGQPAAKSAWMDAETNARTHGFYSSLSESMNAAYIRPTYRGFHELELAGGQILQRFWDGTQTLQDTLNQLCRPSIRTLV